jgi:BirA family biotin operon repressor/biotin-[acetyl-CoA-carboxylase] ligase
MDFDWLREYNLLDFENINSTNSEALRMAKLGIKTKHVLLTQNQYSGRGSRDREWLSSAEDLTFSILLPYLPDMALASHFPFFTANVMYDAVKFFNIDKHTPIELKWPNDILVNGRKVGGILVESIKVSNINYLIIGIGINIAIAPKLENRVMEITSLRQEKIMINHKNDLLNIIMNYFHGAYNIWQNNFSFNIIKRKWLKHAYKLHEIITISLEQKNFTGRYIGLGENGELILELNDKKQLLFSTGEIKFRQKILPK